MSKKFRGTIEVEEVTTSSSDAFDRLYHESALTWEGMDTSSSNLQDVANWLEENNGVVNDKISFVVVKGKAMNKHYHLTGDNAYPDDLNILCVENYGSGAIMSRFAVGGRWFDDVVDNNKYSQSRINKRRGR